MQNKIKKIREERGIKQNELAKLSCLSEGYICHLERGTRKNPTYQTMIKIANALNKDIGEVFELE
jgi:transcriptional regulator with XRE-family HTH domain